MPGIEPGTTVSGSKHATTKAPLLPYNVLVDQDPNFLNSLIVIFGKQEFNSYDLLKMVTDLKQTLKMLDFEVEVNDAENNFQRIRSISIRCKVKLI